MMASSVEKISKAYNFFLDKEMREEFFTVSEVSEATGWKQTTVNTYINKQWKKFIIKTRAGYSCKGISNISQAEFFKINSQKLKFELPHLYGDNILAYKARHFGLLAIATYNNPFSEFRVYGYIVHVIIAWTSLFHGIFQKEKQSFFYLDRSTKAPKRIDGDDMAWDLSQCIDEYWKNTESPIKSNLHFLIKLRNKIEHRLLPALDMKIAGHCQACLLNFEELIIEKFGEEYVLGSNLAIALQLTTLSEDAQVKAMKQLQSKQYSLVKNFMDSFEKELSDDILKSEKYRLRLFLIPNSSNHKTSADLSLEFVKYNGGDSELTPNKYVELIKKKMVTVENLEHCLKPGKVVAMVKKRLQKKFTTSDHTCAWKTYNIRPSTSKSDKCNKTYVQWSEITDSYLYSEKWVDFLVEKLNNLKEYKRIVKNPEVP